MKKLLYACALLAASQAAVRAEDSTWVDMFNGKDLKDWVPKFTGKALGVNPDSVFRVGSDGLLEVHLTKQEGYGHLFYNKRSFTYYMVRAEFKFTADKSVTGYPSWSDQNNGIMINCQPPASMALSQDYPNSIEVQLLGPKSPTGAISADWPAGHTGNMCTPGTFVAYNGNNNYTTHCTVAQYPDAWKKTMTPWDKEWAMVTARVLSDSLGQNFVNGAKVMEYSKIRLDDGTPVKGGYISIQAEGTSTLFRKIQVLDLVGCMDKTSPAYRSYFVKNDAAACKATAVGGSNAATREAPFHMARAGRNLEVTGPGAFTLEIAALDGKVAARADGSGRAVLEIPATAKGLLLARVKSPAGTAVFRAIFVAP